MQRSNQNRRQDIVNRKDSEHLKNPQSVSPLRNEAIEEEKYRGPLKEIPNQQIKRENFDQQKSGADEVFELTIFENFKFYEELVSTATKFLTDQMDLIKPLLEKLNAQVKFEKKKKSFLNSKFDLDHHKKILELLEKVVKDYDDQMLIAK